MLRKIANHFEKYGYLNLKLNGKKVDRYSYGPPGELLIDNIRREWLYNVSLYRENNVFPFHNGEKISGFTKDDIESFLIAKDFNNSEIPFGIVQTRTESSYLKSADPVFPSKTTFLRYVGFSKPSEAEQFFYRWQLQRKRWWRRFSHNPGIFTFAESETSKNVGIKSESTILAKFPWADHELERVQYYGEDILKDIPKSMQNRFQIMDGKKKCLPHIIESWCSLDYAAWTYLCDAFPEEQIDVKNPVIRLHKKLAPFKFTAAAPVVPGDKLKQLLDLSYLILLELRKAGISCLLPTSPPFGMVDLETQVIRSNALAIPYTVIPTLDTLQTGIFGLYSRETTLQEQLHLSKMKDYGKILMEI